MGRVVADSGMSGNIVDVYSCRVDVASFIPKYEGIEELYVMKQEELERKIRDGEIIDGFTLAAYALYKANISK